MKNLKHYIKHPNEFIGGVVVKLNRFFTNDERYLKIIFRCFMKQKLDLEHPHTFSEKLQWLKLYNRKPEYTTMVDKYAVKEYVAEKVGTQYVIPTLGVWERVEDIDWECLPHQFVLKTTHAGGGNGVVICRDKTTFNREKAIAKLGQSMKRNPYCALREWPYKDVKPRIIAEQYIEDKSGNELKDYKFFCFNGQPKCCQVIDGRNSVMTIDFFDNDWEHLPFHEPRDYPFADKVISRPDSYDKMWKLAEDLSQGLPFLRVDLYDVNGRIYFGELTFFPTSGIGGFDPREWDYVFGSWIELPNVKI